MIGRKNDREREGGEESKAVMIIQEQTRLSL